MQTPLIPCSTKTTRIEWPDSPLAVEHLPDGSLAMPVTSILDAFEIECPRAEIDVLEWVVRDRGPELEALDNVLAGVGWTRDQLALVEAFDSFMVMHDMAPLARVLEFFDVYRGLWAKPRGTVDPALLARGLHAGEAARTVREQFGGRE